MAAERQGRSWLDKTKEWGVKVTAITAIGAGAMFLAGCGPSKTGADHVPQSPSVSAPATPGSSETSSPSSSETSQSPEAKETVLTNSEVFNAMTPADQALVEKDSKLSYDQFEQLDEGERSKVALVLMDANSADYLKAAGDLVLPGNFGKALKDMSNAAVETYKYALGGTPDTITATSNNTPYLVTQFETAIAFHMAASGNPQLLEDAKKILGGSMLWQGDKADAAHGNLTEKLQQLEQVSSNKKDDAQYLRFPNALPFTHLFSEYTDGPYKGHPSEVYVGFEIYDTNTQQHVPGPNEDGMTACGYTAEPFALKDGTQQGNWVLKQCTDGQSIGVGGFPLSSLEPDS